MFKVEGKTSKSRYLYK